MVSTLVSRGHARTARNFHDNYDEARTLLSGRPPKGFALAALILLFFRLVFSDSLKTRLDSWTIKCTIIRKNMTEYPLHFYRAAEILIHRSAKHGYLLRYKLQSVTSSLLFAPQRIGSDSVWALIASFTLTKGDTSRPLTWDKGSVSFNSEGGLEGGKVKITGVNLRQTLIIVSTEITNGGDFRPYKF